MRLEDIAAAYEVDPEKEKRFARQICQSLRGRVSVGIWNLVGDAVSIGFLFLILFWMFHGLPGGFLMLLHVPVILVCVIHLWYQLSWELTFDGESGFFSYRTLFHEEIRFHVSEISRFRVEEVSMRRRRSIYKGEVLVIEVGGEKIVVLVKKHFIKGNPVFDGGYTNAGKLVEYLEMYRRFIAPAEWGLVTDGVDPGIAAAIAREKAASVKAEQKKVSLEKAEAEKISLEKAEPEKVSLEKTDAEKVSLEKAEPDAPTVQEASAGKKVTPEVETPQVDVDALFNSVLKEYGKNAERAKPARRRRRKW